MEIFDKNSILLITTIVVALAWSNSPVEGHLAQLAARLPLRGKPALPGSPWPKPANHSADSTLAAISSRDFKFTSGTTGCKILETAFIRYNSMFLFRNFEVRAAPGLHVISEVQISLVNGSANLCNEYPKLNTEDDNYEKYSIQVAASSDNGLKAQAVISAYTIWGALRGIETFSQLIWQDEQNDEFFYVNFTSISDGPRYPHRGFMIDTARHFVDLPIVETILDGMAYNKLNILHWHLVDDQSFPFVSTTYPELSEKGAYLPELTYKPEEVQGIIEYARDRGIRVVLEFDTPGHTLAFGKAFPQLLTPCYGNGSAGTPNYTYHAAYEILDPTKEFTYEFMKSFFSEIKQVSKDEYIHLGMDEVYYACWASSPEIKDFMDANNFTEYNQVQQYYTVRHLRTIKDIGFKSIIFHDPFEFGVELEKDVLIQVWKGGDPGLPEGMWVPYFERVLEAGYNAILSSCWYLNYISYGEAWRKYYECDPVMSLPNITAEQKKLIFGGEAAVWSEFTDSTNLVQRIFPFIGAMAERLWSPEFPISSDLTDDAMHRLDQHRCRLLWRDIPAQPIFNGYCFHEEKSIRKNETSPPPNGESGLNSSKNMLVVFLCLILIYLHV